MENNLNTKMLVLGCFREIDSKKIIGYFNLSKSSSKLKENIDNCIKETNPVENKHEFCIILTNFTENLSLKFVEDNLIQTLWELNASNTDIVSSKYCLDTWQ